MREFNETNHLVSEGWVVGGPLGTPSACSLPMHIFYHFGVQKVFSQGKI